jgi:protein-L-isoaspartate(D-aspartate) O-methyltransferase
MEKLTEDKAKILLELRQQGISDPIIMEAVEKVNHNIFSPEPFVNVIENKSINTENEQYSIARAFAIGIIISNLNLCRLSRVLEISRFSGLQTCILAHICRRVYSLCGDKENKQDYKIF